MGTRRCFLESLACIVGSGEGAYFGSDCYCPYQRSLATLSFFAWQVVADKLDAYVSYRLIEPGYEVWNALQIRERCIENFEERILADNSQTDGKCMNCHVHGGNSGNLSMFHLRGEGGDYPEP